MRQEMPILIRLTGEAFRMAIAAENRTLLGPSLLVCQHVPLEIFNVHTTGRERTEVLMDFVGWKSPTVSSRC